MSLYELSIRVEQRLLLLLVVFALTSRQPRWFILIAATLTLGSILWHVHSPRDVIPHNSFYEVYEYLLGLAGLCYALELLLAQRRQAAVSPPPDAASKAPRAYVPLWLAASVLVMVGSGGADNLEICSNQGRTENLAIACFRRVCALGPLPFRFPCHRQPTGLSQGSLHAGSADQPPYGSGHYPRRWR